jgi:hypothetical protein
MDRINRKSTLGIVLTCTILFLCGGLVSPCLADEGDSPLEAYFLPHDTVLEGTIGDNYAADYYKVIVPATGRLVVTLYDINLNDTRETVNISLFRTTQNSIGTGYTTYSNYVAESANPSATPDVIDIPDLARGIYFVAVSPAAYHTWNGADYKIKATCTVFPPVVRDDVGDKKEYALPTVNQLPTICSLSGNNDVDYFECHLPNNTDLTISLTEIDAGGNVDLEVYTAWDVMIGSVSQPGDVNELLYLADLVPGQYFIKVFGEGTPQYTFTVIQKFTEASDILDDVGNSLAHAMPLLPGNPSVFCLQPYGTDGDYFSVYQPQDGPLTIDVYNLFFWDKHEDLHVYLYDEYGSAIALSDNGTPTPEHVEVNVTRGQYFVGVHGDPYHAFNGVIYTINVQTNGADVGDAFNRAMQIHAIPYGSETYGYPYIGLMDRPGDVDFFQLVLKDTGFIYVELDRMLHSNVDVQLFDASHALLQTSANLQTEPEAIYVDDLDAGVYFVKVYSPDDDVSQYRLTPTIGTPTSTISDDLGDGFPRAFPLLPYRRVNGYIWSEYTSDYFRFSLPARSDWVRVCVGNQQVWDAHEDIALCLYDESEVQIGSSDNDRLEDECVELRDLDAGTYYAQVLPQPYHAMNPVQYAITVETPAAPLPSAELSIPAEIQAAPGKIVYVPVGLNNPGPDAISSMSIGLQFDSGILEPVGVQNAGLTLRQWSAQVRYSRSGNSISVSMDNFLTTESGPLLELILKVRPDVSVGDTSPLTVSAALLNGASVPAADGVARVIPE